MTIHTPYSKKTTPYSDKTNPYSSKQAYSRKSIDEILLTEEDYPLLQESGYNIIL